MKQRLITLIILIVYSALLIKIMVFKDMPMVRLGSLYLNFGGTHEGNANLVPFKTIWPYLLGEKGLIIAGINLIGNIILLVPIGFLFPFVFMKMNWRKIIAIAIAAGFTIEGLQVILHVGIFDIDDVILNGLGVLIGYWLFKVLPKVNQLMKSKIAVITTILLTFVVLSFLGVYIYQNHRLPISLEAADVHMQLEPMNDGKNITGETKDPCGGTDGTGQITSVGQNKITIQRKDGVQEEIKITAITKIVNSAGNILASDLKIGYRVTVVVGLVEEDSRIASAILVCNLSK